MKNLISKSDCAQVINRVGTLTSQTKNLWGKMNVNEMICHVSDPFRDILGIRNTPLVIPEEMRVQFVPVILNENPFEKNAPSVPPYLQGEGGSGTKPSTFENAKKTLLNLMDAFQATDTSFKFYSHGVLGILSRDEFGIYLWKHLDHHLRQFGV